MKEMTKREFLMKVRDEVKDETLSAYADYELRKMDEANEKRKARPTKAQKENGPLMEALRVALKDGDLTAKMGAEKLQVSTQKASALFRTLEKLGVVTSRVEKVGKATAKVYSLQNENA